MAYHSPLPQSSQSSGLHVMTTDIRRSEISTGTNTSIRNTALERRVPPVSEDPPQGRRVEIKTWLKWVEVFQF